jgi:hypothetical protein
MRSAAMKGCGEERQPPMRVAPRTRGHAGLELPFVSRIDGAGRFHVCRRAGSGLHIAPGAFIGSDTAFFQGFAKRRPSRMATPDIGC